MIVMKLSGGMGNQLFQYAAGRSLALSLGVDMEIEISGYKNNSLRTFELGCFKIKAKPTSLITEIRLKMSSSKLRYFFPPSIIFKQFREKDFSYDHQFFLQGKNTCIEGYWQSEKYFSKFRKEIVREFQLNYDLGKVSKSYLIKIQNSNSVGLHIRRGDYVSNPVANNYHGVLPLSYYEKALSHLSSDNSDLKVFVFSDDLDWAQKHLSSRLPMIFVVNDHGSAADEIFLMSNCKHNIIANSSFSWWGAWLNENERKRVYAPIEWFKDSSVKTHDLLPPEWIKV